MDPYNTADAENTERRELKNESDANRELAATVKGMTYGDYYNSTDDAEIRGYALNMAKESGVIEDQRANFALGFISGAMAAINKDRL